MMLMNLSPHQWKVGTLSKPRRQRQRERGKTKE